VKEIRQIVKKMGIENKILLLSGAPQPFTFGEALGAMEKFFKKENRPKDEVSIVDGK
jgi:hypothetical protein